MKQKNKPSVLITGITGGIGKALAREFAVKGHNLIGISRHEDELKEVVEQVALPNGVYMDYIVKDLADDKAPQEIYEQVREWDLEVDILVNNAGISQKGDFVNMSPEKISAMIHLNMLALTQLSRLFLKDMVRRDKGKILQLGSISGFQPGPLQAVYHATKAYVVSLSEAMSIELEDMKSSVTVTCLCPGPTDTESFSKADMSDTLVMEFKDKIMHDPDEVARGAYKALMDEERIYIPGVANKIMTFVRRAIPRSTQSRIQKKFYESYEE